jgi:hypothetical protein
VIHVGVWRVTANVESGHRGQVGRALRARRIAVNIAKLAKLLRLIVAT